MRIKSSVATLVVLFGLTLLFTPAAQAQNNTTCDNAVVLVPDGSPFESVFTGAFQSRFFRFVARANRSYAVMIDNLDSPDINSIIFTSTTHAGTCAGPAATGAADDGLVDATEPGAFTGSSGSGRFSFKDTNPGTIFFEIVGNTNGNYRVRVEDTTLYSPAWSTFGTFETFYSCVNYTNQGGLDATLKLFDTTGAQVASFDFVNVPAGGTVSRNTGATSLNVGNNLNGSAVLTHNGPAGAFICEAAIADFTTSPRVIQPVQFKRRNNN